MNPKDLLIAAGDFTIGLLPETRQEFFTKFAAATIQTCGSEIVGQLQASDRPGVFAPVDVLVNGKWEQGGVLTLTDRAIIAWFTGTFRVKTFSRVVRFAEITRVVPTAVEPARMHSDIAERVVLTIEGKESLSIRVLRFKESAILEEMIQGALTGAVTFTHNEEAFTSNAPTRE